MSALAKSRHFNAGQERWGLKFARRSLAKGIAESSVRCVAPRKAEGVKLMASYEENVRYVRGEIQSALGKLKASMHRGPDGIVTLTNSEGTIIYRLLTEQLGIEHRGDGQEAHRLWNLNTIK
jgi:hypothetical protein